LPEESAEAQDEDIVLPSYSPRIMGEIIQDAINRRRSLLIQYQNAWSARPGLRKVNPVSVDLSGPQPSLSGHCHVHGGARAFKLSRITGIRLLEDERF
jgi:predicted DNA-binding transcriptional regulator YafY